MTPTPEELDEAVGLAARTLEGQDSIEQIRQAPVVDDMLGLECEDSIALERLIASNATNAPPLARAVLALAAENERLRGLDGWVRDLQKAIEQRTAERIAAYVRPTGDHVPLCCDECARRWEALTECANGIAAGAWRPAQTGNDGTKKEESEQ